MKAVLVVEPNAIIRLGLTEALQASGYCVFHAGNEGTAIRIASCYFGFIHALVTDVHMPELDGHELGRKLRLNRPTMRIVIVSTHTKADFALNLQHHALFEKPINPYVVASAVKELLHSDKKPGSLQLVSAEPGLYCPLTCESAREYTTRDWNS